MNRSKTIEALLALAEGNPNEYEGLAALLKAQKLLKEDQRKETQEPQIVDRVLVRRTDAWLQLLAATIAEYFRVFFYLDEGGADLPLACWYCGEAPDVEVASEVFTQLMMVGRKNAGEWWSANPDNSPAALADYLWGFVQGVKERLKRPIDCEDAEVFAPLSAAVKKEISKRSFVPNKTWSGPVEKQAAWSAGVERGKTYESLL